MSDTDSAEKKKLVAATGAVSQESGADVLLFNGPIRWSSGKKSLACLCDAKRTHDNLFLILVTSGGDPDAAYRIARCLQSRYKRITVLIPSMCKSAGTLVAVGAHELVMADDGELGPLDVQLRKEDELFGMSSGLDVDEALTSLREKSYKVFENNLYELNIRSGGRISLKTAMQIACELTVGLFRPIYEQIDPMRVGEIAREIKIADEYGKRLNSRANNLKDGALERLIATYPSHDFIIDRTEAKELFKTVRGPTASEINLLKALDVVALKTDDEHSFVTFLEIPTEENKEGVQHDGDSKNPQGTGQAAATTPQTTGGESVAEIATFKPKESSGQSR
jgi:hypothetical protein